MYCRSGSLLFLRSTGGARSRIEEKEERGGEDSTGRQGCNECNRIGI